MLLIKIKEATVFILLSLPLLAMGQENDIKKYLSEKENKKIASAEKLINKGNALLEKISPIEEEINALKNADGRIKTRKINKLNKKIAEDKLKAAVYFEDGYDKHIKVLDKRLKEMEKAGDTQAGQTRDQADELEKKARKQFNKSERLSEPGEMVELVELARENQLKAIALQETFILSVLAGAPEKAELIAEEVNTDMQALSDSTSTLIEEQMEEQADEQTAQQDTITNTALQSATTLNPEPANSGAGAVAVGAGLVTAAAVNNTEEQTNVMEEPLVEETAALPLEEEVVEVNKDVFLSIQIFADKQKANQTQINQAYSGSLEVLEMIGNGWYRYSVGKFTDVETARETMKSEGIKGFIVAYNKDQRISVKEAIELIGSN